MIHDTEDSSPRLESNLSMERSRSTTTTPGEKQSIVESIVDRYTTQGELPSGNQTRQTMTCGQMTTTKCAIAQVELMVSSKP